MINFVDDIEETEFIEEDESPVIGDEMGWEDNRPWDVSTPWN